MFLNLKVFAGTLPYAHSNLILSSLLTGHNCCAALFSTYEIPPVDEVSLYEIKQRVRVPTPFWLIEHLIKRFVTKNCVSFREPTGQRKMQRGSVGSGRRGWGTAGILGPEAWLRPREEPGQGRMLQPPHHSTPPRTQVSKWLSTLKLTNVWFQLVLSTWLVRYLAQHFLIFSIYGWCSFDYSFFQVWRRRGK